MDFFLSVITGHLNSSPVYAELFDCYVLCVRHSLSISGFPFALLFGKIMPGYKYTIWPTIRTEYNTNRIFGNLKEYDTAKDISLTDLSGSQQRAAAGRTGCHTSHGHQPSPSMDQLLQHTVSLLQTRE